MVCAKRQPNPTRYDYSGTLAGCGRGVLHWGAGGWSTMFPKGQMEVSGHILIVDPEQELREEITDALLQQGHQVDQVGDGGEALSLLVRRGYHLVITDLDMPGASGMEIISYVREHTPKTPVVVVTGQGSVDAAVDAMRSGAFEFLEKPLSIEQLVVTAQRALERAALDNAYDYLRHEQPYIYRMQDLLAESPAMKKVLELVTKVAPSEATVLLTGETGTGKSLIGGAIHFNSPRRTNQLVTVNCAAMTETLLESELFGHERGSFTGAHKARTGRFQQAHGGSLFLDEVGDMSPALQAKVLRAIEEKVIERVGGSRSIHVDVRIIAATNRNLMDDVRKGRFREDLYYRLRVAPIHLPPLRDRSEDIIPLARKFAKRSCEEAKRARLDFSPAAIELLSSHSWPGNIREMRNAVERAVLFCDSHEITPESLELKVGRAPADGSLPLTTLNLAELERRAIEQALAQSGWVQSNAAKLLGISPRALSYKLDKLGISHPSLRSRRRR